MCLHFFPFLILGFSFPFLPRQLEYQIDIRTCNNRTVPGCPTWETIAPWERGWGCGIATLRKTYSEGGRELCWRVRLQIPLGRATAQQRHCPASAAEVHASLATERQASREVASADAAIFFFLTTCSLFSSVVHGAELEFHVNTLH